MILFLLAGTIVFHNKRFIFIFFYSTCSRCLTPLSRQTFSLLRKWSTTLRQSALSWSILWILSTIKSFSSYLIVCGHSLYTMSLRCPQSKKHVQIIYKGSKKILENGRKRAPKESKNRNFEKTKSCVFSHVPRSIMPKNRFLAKKLWPVAGRTHRQTHTQTHRDF